MGSFACSVSKMRLDSGCGCCSLTVCCNVQGYLVLVAIAALMVTNFVITIRVSAQGDNCSNFPICWRDVSLVMFFVLSVYMFGTIMLLRGIYKREPQLLLHYIRVLCLHLFLSTVALMWGISRAVDRHLLILVILINLGLVFYMLLCVNTLYLQMREESTRTSTDLDGIDRCTAVDGGGVFGGSPRVNSSPGAPVTPAHVAVTATAPQTSAPPTYLDAVTYGFGPADPLPERNVGEKHYYA